MAMGLEYWLVMFLENAVIYAPRAEGKPTMANTREAVHEQCKAYRWTILATG